MTNDRKVLSMTNEEFGAVLEEAKKQLAAGVKLPELLRRLASAVPLSPEQKYEAYRQDNWDWNLPEWKDLPPEKRKEWIPASAVPAGPRCRLCQSTDLTLYVHEGEVYVHCSDTQTHGAIPIKTGEDFKQFFAPSPATGQPPRCGKPAASLIPRLGMSWACALDKGHEGECSPGGNCIKHGPYICKPNEQPKCPQWPDCIPAAVPAPESPLPQSSESEVMPTEIPILRSDRMSESGSAISASLKTSGLAEPVTAQPGQNILSQSRPIEPTAKKVIADFETWRDALPYRGASDDALFRDWMYIRLVELYKNAAHPESAAKVEEIAAEIIRTLRPADPGSWAMNMPYVVARLHPYIPSQPPAIEQLYEAAKVINSGDARKDLYALEGLALHRYHDTGDRKYLVEALDCRVMLKNFDSNYPDPLVAPVTPVSQPPANIMHRAFDFQPFREAAKRIDEVIDTASLDEIRIRLRNLSAELKQREPVAPVSGNGLEPEGEKHEK